MIRKLLFRTMFVLIALHCSLSAFAEGFTVTVTSETNTNWAATAWRYLFDGTNEHWAVKSGTPYVEFKTSEAICLTNYAFMTGADLDKYPTSNPVSWKFYGKANESDTWTLIQSIDNGGLTATNHTWFYFHIDNNTKSYAYYRIEFVNGGCDFTQLGEMKLNSCNHDNVGADGKCSVCGYAVIPSAVSTVQSQLEESIIGVYDMQGRKVSDDTENLPSGVYIVRTNMSSKKIFVK